MNLETTVPQQSSGLLGNPRFCQGRRGFSRDLCAEL